MLSESETGTGVRYQQDDTLPVIVTGNIHATVPMHWHVHLNDQVAEYQVEVLEDGLQIRQ